MRLLRRTAAPWAALLGVALLAAGPLSAATVQRLPLRDRAAMAEAVVLARVEGRRVEVDGRGRPWTLVRLRAERVVLDRAGQLRPGARFEVALMGGPVGSRRMVVPGEAVLPVGARFVLLLWRDGRGRLRPLGMAFGALPVRRGQGGRLEAWDLGAPRPGPRAGEGPPGTLRLGGAAGEEDAGETAPAAPPTRRWPLEELLRKLGRWAREGGR